jgi:hypothetical protein
MTIDFDKLRGETAAEEIPADGTHTARLERCVIVTSNRTGDELLVTEWSDEQNVMWTSFNRFDSSGMSFTQELLDGLGVDRSKLTDENLGDELAQAEGGTYQVRTTSTKGSQGDRWFINTYVDQVIAGRQKTLDEDIPADTTGLPERDAAPAGADLFGDEPAF